MFCRCVQLLVALLVLAFLASCGSLVRRPIDRPLYYDVRDVAVLAGASVPPRIIAGVDRRIRESIFATVRNEPLPRVVLTVTLQDFGPIGMFGNRRMGTTFRVVATSVDSGIDIAAGSYQVMSVTDEPGLAEDSLAEEIAARVRYAFSLAMPQAMTPLPRPRAARVGGYYAPSSPFGRSGRVLTEERPPVRQSIEPAAPAPASADPSPQNPVSPVPTIMPQVDRPLGPVPIPRPVRPEEQPARAPAGSVGTNTEQGASGVIQLRPATPAPSVAPGPSVTPPPPLAPAASAAPASPVPACNPQSDPSCRPAN